MLSGSPAAGPTQITPEMSSACRRAGSSSRDVRPISHRGSAALVYVQSGPQRPTGSAMGDNHTNPGCGRYRPGSI